MCGRLFMNLNPNQLRQIARSSAVKNQDKYKQSFNMGPTHYIPCIRKQTSGNQNQEKKDNDVTNKSDKMQPNQDDQKDQNKKAVIYPDEGFVTCSFYVKSKSMFQQKSSKEIKSTEPTNEQNFNDEQIAAQRANEECEDQVKDRLLDFMFWGYNTEFQNIINIRSEEAEMKKTFIPFLKKNRCVIVTQGYYEWTPDKIPYVFNNPEKDYMFICAIYCGQSEQVMLLTRESFGKFDKVHHRMPVFIEENEIEQWLDPEIPYNEVLFKQLLRRDRSVYDEISSYRCSTNVNNVREQNIKCLMSYEEHKALLDKNGISKFFIKTNKVTEITDEKVQKIKSYYQLQQEIVQNQQTLELAEQLNSISVNDDKKDEQKQDKDNQNIQVQLQNVDSGLKLENNGSKKQKNVQTIKQINPLKRERPEEQENNQSIGIGRSKNQKVKTTSINLFNEGLEEFFKAKNNKEKK